MMNIYFLSTAFVLHFIADFLLQPRWMGTRKSSEFKVLLMHLGIQFGVMTSGLLLMSLLWLFKDREVLAYYHTTIMDSFLKDLSPVLLFGILNTLIHGIIDWNIWKLYKFSAHIRISRFVRQKATNPDGTISFSENQLYQDAVKNWKYWEDSVFYDTIGFDQLLHGLTILGLAWMAL
jgi:hypothetical protein